MRYLKLLASIVLFLVFTNIVYSYPCIRYQFKQGNTDVGVTNVEWSIYSCKYNANCNQNTGVGCCTDVVTDSSNANYWHLTGNSGGNAFADIQFRPTLPNSGWYLLHFLNNNYIFRAYIQNPSDNEKIQSGCQREPTYWETGNQIIRFFQKDACVAQSSLVVSNEIGDWLPLTMDTNTLLESNTANAIECGQSLVGVTRAQLCSWHYLTEAKYQKYRGVDTSVSLIISDKKTLSPVFTSSQSYNIPYDQSKNFQFAWLEGQSYPGNFTVTLTSHVTDPKCSSVVDDVQKQDIEVFPELPDQACVIVQDPIKLTPDKLNRLQEGTFDISAYYYYMDLIYRGEYENLPQGTSGWYDQWVIYKPVTAKAKFTITNQDGTTQGIPYVNFAKPFSSNIISRPDNNYADGPTKGQKTAKWTPLKYGNFDIKIEMTSEDPICMIATTNDYSRGTRILNNFNVAALDNDNDGAKEDTDCNDNDPAIKPGAPDTTCDGIDQNCDGVDRTLTNQCACTENTKKTCTEFGKLGMCGSTIVTCTNGAYPACPTKISDEVCDDAAQMDEDCDGKSNCDDTNCNGFIKDFLNPCLKVCTVGHYDLNKDLSDGCEYACNVTNNRIEICDSKDNDCNGVIDESMRKKYYNDSDKDGYGNSSTEIEACAAPSGFIETPGDCNDKNKDIFPQDINEKEKNLCDDIDNDCDGTPDEFCACSLDDPITCAKKQGVCAGLNLKCSAAGIRPECNYALIPEYEETEKTCDGKDNDCDGATDELSTCCNPNTNPRRSCKKECWDATVAAGFESCVNFVYDTTSCTALCPKPPNAVQILFPLDGETYYVDFQVETKPFSIDFDGPNVQCQYKFNSGSAIGLNEDTRIIAKLGENRLLVKCEGVTAQSVFYLKQKETQKIVTETETDVFLEEGIDKEEIDKAKDTKATVETAYDYNKGDTVVTNSIIPQEDIGDATYYLHIPKCMTEYLKDLEFDLKYNEVIKEDPLIAWHFSNLKERVDLTYRIKGKIPEDCLKQLNGLLAKRLNIEKPNPIKHMLIPGLIIAVVICVFIFLQRFHPQVTNVELSEEESEKLGIENARKMLLARIKQQGFKSISQAENYMNELQLDSDTKIWLLSKL